MCIGKGIRPHAAVNTHATMISDDVIFLLLLIFSFRFLYPRHNDTVRSIQDARATYITIYTRIIILLCIPWLYNLPTYQPTYCGHVVPLSSDCYTHAVIQIQTIVYVSRLRHPRSTYRTRIISAHTPGLLAEDRFYWL